MHHGRTESQGDHPGGGPGDQAPPPDRLPSPSASSRSGAGLCSITGSTAWPEAGVVEARVNNHAHAEQVREHCRRGLGLGPVAACRVRTSPTLLGSAGTIAANADLADGADEVVIVYADNFSDVDLKAMLDFHRSHDDPFTMLLFRAPNPSACGIAELDGEGRVVSFVEKPKRAEKRPRQRRGLHRRRRRLPRDRGDEGVRPRLRGPAEIRRPDAGLGLGRLSPRRRHA